MKKRRLELSPLRARTVRKQKILFTYKNLEVSCHQLSPTDSVLVDCDVLSPARSVGDSFRFLGSNIGQRAAIAVETLPHLIENAAKIKTANLKNQQHSSSAPIGAYERSAAVVAKAAHVGRTSVSRAWMVKRSDPEATTQKATVCHGWKRGAG